MSSPTTSWRQSGTPSTTARIGAIVKLLMLTGCRKRRNRRPALVEIDFDKALIMLPGARTKNCREHLIPLSAPALAVLDGATAGGLTPTGAPRISFSAAAIEAGKIGARARTSSTPASDRRFLAGDLHDLRRSISTGLHEKFDAPPHSRRFWVTAGPGRESRGSTISADYLDLRRVALTRWADHVVGLATGEKPSTVVTLRR